MVAEPLYLFTYKFETSTGQDISFLFCTDASNKLRHSFNNQAALRDWLKIQHELGKNYALIVPPDAVVNQFRNYIGGHNLDPATANQVREISDLLGSGQQRMPGKSGDVLTV